MVIQKKIKIIHIHFLQWVFCESCNSEAGWFWLRAGINLTFLFVNSIWVLLVSAYCSRLYGNYIFSRQKGKTRKVSTYNSVFNFQQLKKGKAENSVSPLLLAHKSQNRSNWCTTYTKKLYFFIAFLHISDHYHLLKHNLTDHKIWKPNIIWFFHFFSGSSWLGFPIFDTGKKIISVQTVQGFFLL